MSSVIVFWYFGLRTRHSAVVTETEIYFQRYLNLMRFSPTFPLGGGWDDPNCARRTSTFSPLLPSRAGQ